MSSSCSCETDDGCTEYETFFWGCTLTKQRPSVRWGSAEGHDSSDGEDEDHTLHLKQAVLGMESVAGQRNIVQLEMSNYSEEIISYPILCLTFGRKEMCHLRMQFESTKPMTLRLIAGDGPVHITGEHVVEYEAESDDSDSDNDVTSKMKEYLKPKPLVVPAKLPKKSFTSYLNELDEKEVKNAKANKQENGNTSKKKEVIKREPMVSALASQFSPMLPSSPITFPQSDVGTTSLSATNSSRLIHSGFDSFEMTSDFSLMSVHSRAASKPDIDANESTRKGRGKPKTVAIKIVKRKASKKRSNGTTTKVKDE